MNEIIKVVESKEQQEKAKIILHFFRHDEKESDKTKSDTEIRLTEKGRLHSKGLSRKETDMSQAMAFGSPRKRAQETAGLIMAGAQDEITGTETLEELKTKLNKDLKYGSKLHTDSRFDFELPPKGIYHDEVMLAFKESRFMKYLVEESDKRTEETGSEKDVINYSNLASQVAEIIEKYFKIMPRWKNLVKDEKKNYKSVMERFMVTHLSVQEAFLAKIIELTKGKSERDAFVSALNNQGFDYAEGFDVEIVADDNGEGKIHITYKKEKEGKIVFEFDEIVPVGMIENIIMKK